jgi:hypothetical protein
VPTFSAMCATILVLLKGLAAIFYFYPPQIFKSASNVAFETSRAILPL